MDWKQKLTSRKFWTAVSAFVTNLILAFGGTQSEAAKVAAIIMAGAAVVAYIIGEGLVDAAGASAPMISLPVNLEEENKPPEEVEEPFEKAEEEWL